MSEQLTVEQIEKRSFRLTLQDGLIDIQVGSSLLLISAAALFAERGANTLLSFGMAIAAAVLIAVLLQLVKHGLILPRMGRVVFSQARRRKITTMIWIVMATVILSAVVVQVIRIAARNDPNLAGSGIAIWGIVIFFGLVVFGIFSGLTYFLDEPRLMIYGVLIGAAVPVYFAIQEYTDLTIILPFLMVGSALLGIGVYMLIRFLNKYPAAPLNTIEPE